MPGEITRRSFLAGAAAGLTLACGLPRDSAKHIVVVNVDQLRKDASDLYLHRVNTLADSGVVFEQMRSVAPWTYPSVVSLMSGLLPQQHGADGHLFRNRLASFDERVPTLQKILREHGYRTQGFVTNPFLHDWNAFHQGFDHYDISFVNSQGNLRGFGDIVWKPEGMFADRVNAAIMKYFDAQPIGPPEFSYVHYIDVHGPWEGAPFPGTYEDAIRFVDTRILEIYEYFGERYDGEMLFFVTSDHGKGRDQDTGRGSGRRWRKSKASLHDFNLRIPAMLLPSDHTRSARRVGAACSNVDFVPTVLSWLGIEAPIPLPGRSLMPEIQGRGGQGAAPPVYAKMSAFGTLSDALVDGQRKTIRFFDPKTQQLLAERSFDLASDPEEEKPLDVGSNASPAEFERAAADRGVRFEGQFEETDPQLLERLRVLGYLR